MLQVQVVSKEHHSVLENIQTSNISLKEASVVVIHTSKENVLSMERSGNTLIIKMKDGQQLIIENYFTDNPNENNVVLEEDDKLYLLETNPNEAGLFEINYNPIDEINPLLYSDSTVGLWTWLFPLVTAGGILAWANNDSDSSSGSGNSNQALDAAEKAVKAAEDANKAAKDALTDAQADGLITPEEKTKLEQALADAKAAEDAAQKAVDALKDSTEKDDLQDRLDNLTDIVIPPVTDADGNGINDTVDAQIADAEAAVKAAEDAYQAAEDALSEAESNGLITPTEKAELEEALKAAQDAKDAAQAAVDALPSAPAAVQDAKDGFQDRIDALTDITIPAVNDANENGVDDSTENPVDLATDLVEAAEDAYQAAEDALTDANADGLITPEEKAALEDALKDAQDAKDAAQNAVDALPDSADKDALQDRIDALTDIEIPAVTDTDGNGIDDTVDAQIADAEAAVKAAEDAYQAAEDALEEANANGLITPTEKAELEEALKAAQDAKDAAQDAVDALPSAPAAVQDAKDGLQDRIDALTDITIPAVNDANENGVDDSTENPVDLATDLVEAAEDAYQAAEDALTDANTDGLITPEEKAALEDALKDAQDAKDAAQNAVDALPDSADKDALQDRIDALTDIVIPPVTDADGNGIDDTVDAQIADAEAAVKAAEDAYQAAEDALEEANANGLITPTEKAELEEALKAAQDAKDAAQDAVDALPSAPAAVQDAKDGFQDRIDALTDITIPAVNDANENGVDDSTENPVDLATDLVEAAEDAYQAAEDALTDANADGLITPEEKAALEDALKDAQDAKDAAQNAVDALPDSADKDALQDRIDALTDIVIPPVTDADGNGIDDAVDAQIADAEAAVKAAEDAYQAAEDALEEANANGLITPTEKAELEDALKAAQDAKDAAQDAVNALPSAPAAVQDAKDGFQDRIDALTDITIPAVTDSNNNGVDDAVDAQIADAEAAVKAAEDAYQAAEDALEEANANGLITPTEKAELEEALKAAQDAKDVAQDAVDALPSAPAAVQDAKDGFQDRIDALTDITIPAVNDANENGVDDSTENPVDLATDLVEAAEDAYQAAEDALTDANTDGLITPEEKAALEDALKDAQDAKELAQNAVDALPAGTDKDDLQDRLDNLTDIVIPAVTDSNNNGVDDATEIAAVEDLVAAAEQAYQDAADALTAAQADNSISQAEVDALTQDLADAQAAKAAAQAAVDGIVADFPAEAADFQDRIDALTDIVIPAVTHNITADDDQNSTNYELSTTESRADIEGSIFTLANAGVLGGIISLDLSTSTNPKITVANNETLNFTLTASGSTGLTAGALGALVDALLAGGSVNGTMDLVILKDNGAGKYEVYNVLENVYTLNNALLTFTASGSAAVTLNEAGNYSFVLAPNGSETNNLLTQLLSLNVLGSLNLDANGTVIATINNTDPVTGNVFDNDVINPVGLDVKVTTVTHGADNQGVVAGTPTVIEGQYGTLTINSDGTYSYQMTADGTALGKVDTFSYTIADGDGHSSVANIYIRLDSTLVNLDWTGKTGAQEATKATNVLVADVDGTAATLANQYNKVVNGNGDAAGSVLTTGQTTLGVQSIPDDSGTFTVAAGQTAYIAFTTVVPTNVTQNFGLIGGNQTTSYTTTVELLQKGTVLDTSLATWSSNATQNGTVHYYKVTNTGTSDATYSLKVSGSDGVTLYDFNNTLTAQFGVNNIQLDVKAPTYIAAAVTGNVITGTDSAGEDTLYSSSFKLGAVAGTTEPAGYNVGTGTAIVGSYGTLTINADGSYSYLANGKVSDLGKVDVFTYKVETLDGSSASSTLSITLGKESVLIGNPTGGTAGDDVAVSQGGAETFTLGTGQDTLIFNVLNSTDALGGNGHDTWSDFSKSQGDVIDISSLLSGATAANIASYVSVTTSNGVSTISIDRDGAGTTYNSKVDLLTINEASTLEELIKGNHLIY